MLPLAYIDTQSGLPPLPASDSSWAAVALWIAAGVALLAVLAAVLAWSWRRGGASLSRVGAPVALAALAAIVAWRCGLLPTGARTPAHEVARGPRVLVLAMDGMDPGLLSQYMAEGKLPNFQRLAAEGRYHPLPTTLPPASPVAWVTVITGLSPAEHGIFDFLSRDPRTYTFDLTLGNRKKLALLWRGTPFWDKEPIRSLGFCGLRVPMTFPPPSVHNGRLLAGMGVWDIRGTLGQYTLYTEESASARPIRGLGLPLKRAPEGLLGEIPGPFEAGNPARVSEPLVLRPSDGGGVLRVSDRDYFLPEGRWSDWIHVVFHMPDRREFRAITRVIYTREPEVVLYMSPIEFDPTDSPYPISYPADFAAQLARRIGLYRTLGKPFDQTAYRDGVLTAKAFLDQCSDATDESEKMLLLSLADTPRGVVFAYFEATDIIQHQFWSGIDEKPLFYGPRPREAPEVKDAIPQAYQRCDAILGRARQAAGPDTTVMVISDHGFAPFRRMVSLNVLLRDLGYLAMLPGRTTGGEGFDGVDWSRTRAYAGGFVGLYLNIAGREGQGIVKPEEAAGLAARIARVLEAVVDPETGEHPIKKVYLAAEAYPGCNDPNCPDLFIGYARGYRASFEMAAASVSGRPFEVNAYDWRGDHLIDPTEVPGVFLSSDPRLDVHQLTEVGGALNSYLARELTEGSQAAHRVGR